MYSNFIRIIYPFLFIFLFYYCSEDNSINQPPDQNKPNYFPDSEGSFYKYEIVETDSNGLLSIGFRNVYYMEDTVINRTPYQKQKDSVQSNGQNSITESYFRTTGTGVFYFVDTTGIINLFPDSILSSIDLQSEMRAFLFPLASGNSWPVYRISIILDEFANYNIVDFTGKYLNDEPLQLNLNGELKLLDTKKIEYNFLIQTDPAEEPVIFRANSWLAEDIGVVKREGNSLILGLLSGSVLELSDTSIVVTHNLIEYDIK